MGAMEGDVTKGPATPLVVVERAWCSGERCCGEFDDSGKYEGEGVFTGGDLI